MSCLNIKRGGESHLPSYLHLHSIALGISKPFCTGRRGSDIRTPQADEPLLQGRRTAPQASAEGPHAIFSGYSRESTCSPTPTGGRSREQGPLSCLAHLKALLHELQLPTPPGHLSRVAGPGGLLGTLECVGVTCQDSTAVPHIAAPGHSIWMSVLAQMRYESLDRSPHLSLHHFPYL